MKAPFLSHFTPSMMQPETLEAIFVQREAIAQDIGERIRDSVLTPTKHHTLAIGSRGIGKTHLVSLIYHRVQAMADLQDHMMIAWLREEEWGVTSFLDLLIRIFRALEETNPSIAAKVEPLYSLSPEEAEATAAKLLREIIAERTLLLLIENLDDLFNGMGETGQKKLRAFLQQYACCTILATSQSLFNGVSRRTAPFFGFFRPVHLQPLTLDGATQLLLNIAHLKGQTDLEAFIRTATGRARIRAVEHLAGGNHRVYVILAQFLTRESLDDLVSPFMNMLDELTPYYQARMMHLSPQQRKIVEFLCDRRHAIPVKEIAQRCFITQQTASSQLKDLREKGYVQSNSTGRESYYELREPLMRFCMEVKKHRGKPIQLFVDFLRLWYTPTELQQRLASLTPDAILEREYLLHIIQSSADNTIDPRILACEKDLLVYVEQDNNASTLRVAEELVALRGQAQDYSIQGAYLTITNRLEEAIISLDRAIQLDPTLAMAWLIRAITTLGLGHASVALNFANRAVELSPQNSLTWFTQGMALFNLEKYQESLMSFNQAIQIDPANVSFWEYKGELLLKLERYTEFFNACKKVSELGSNKIKTWIPLGIKNLAKKQNYKELINAVDTITVISKHNVEISKVVPVFLIAKAFSLFMLNLWDEGFSVLDETFTKTNYLEGTWIDEVKEAVKLFLDGIFDLICRDLLNLGNWENHARELLKVCDKYQLTVFLRQGILQGMKLASPNVAEAMALAWYNFWAEAVGNRDEFQLPLRLLQGAIRYRTTPDDPRVFLDLPMEERKLLQEILGLEAANEQNLAT